MALIGYARVSIADQNLDRQLSEPRGLGLMAATRAR
jgi:DNA invertase Pin-like site-specific DNA recombinase